MPVTILDVAIADGAQKDERGGITMAEFDRLGLPFFSGCQSCGAQLAPYNAFPSRTGYIQCRHCVEDVGFETVAEFRSFNPETEMATDE